MTDEELKQMEETSKKTDGFVFMREEIKARPINRKKLARNTFLAAISAVVFGIVACVTFALIAPYVMDRFGNSEPDVVEEFPTVITFPEETEEEEMTPEDMLVASDEQEEEPIDYSLYTFLEEQEIKDLLSSVKFSVSDYQDLYKSLSEIAASAEKSLVRVTPVKTGIDWLNNMYEDTSELSGLIIADSGTELFICTRYSLVKGYTNIVVTFVNNVQTRAELINYDTSTDIAVLSVSSENVNEDTKETIAVASLGTSSSSSLVGSPVIAVGSPMGTYGSMNYGMVTSNSGKITVTDNYYKRVVTNIYGSQNASGIIINLKGEVVGVIDTKFAASDTRNLISAIGITELKRTIERLMNRADVVLLGITGSDVPSEAITLGTPDGVFVLSVGLDSPALNAGIQSGDIISKIGNTDINRFADMVNALKAIHVDSTVPIVINRSVQDVYKEITIEVEFTELNK